MARITLEHLTKRFGEGEAAVDDVNLEIADNEFMILVGPSGSGKSTILRMIAGLEDITSGDVVIGERQVNDLAPRDRNLAMVFQNYALYPHLSVYENIAFPLRLHRTPDDKVRERVETAADMLELSDLLDRRPSQLSGGQRQRVAMGRAIVRDADAFLFDEPLSNLDAKLRGQVRTEIARLQNRLAVTTVYVTHDQIEAMTLGDRVAVLRKGMVQQVDAPRELYEQPVNLFVAGFIGSPPMNLMPADVEGSTLHLPIGDMTLTDEVASQVSGHELLIAGVRPEHFAVASQVEQSRLSDGLEFTAHIDVIEWLGSEQFAYIPFEAPPEVREPLEELSRELDSEQLRTQIVVTLDAESRLEEGANADLWLDPSRMHLFDPVTGDNLTHGHGTTTASTASTDAVVGGEPSAAPGGASRSAGGDVDADADETVSTGPDTGTGPNGRPNSSDDSGTRSPR